MGLALSDEGGRFATPYGVLQVASARHASEQITAVIVKEGVQRLVVGLPLTMDGTVGDAARTAVAWGRALGAAAGKPLVFVDEMAEGVLPIALQKYTTWVAAK